MRRLIRHHQVIANVMCSAALALVGDEVAAQHAAHQGAAEHSPGVAWAERLKGQTIVEDVMEGRPERTAMVERQHHRIMQQMEQDGMLSY